MSGIGVGVGLGDRVVVTAGGSLAVALGAELGAAVGPAQPATSVAMKNAAAVRARPGCLTRWAPIPPAGSWLARQHSLDKRFDASAIEVAAGDDQRQSA